MLQAKITDDKLLQAQIQKRIEDCVTLAEKAFQRTFKPPRFNFRLRGVKAGVAYLMQNEIRLNPILCQENPTEFLQQIVPHEVAHLIAFQQFGQVKPHGKEWQFIMQSLFHCPAQVRHRLNTANVQGKTYAYRCACQTHQLSVFRQKRILKGARYFCRRCGESLTPA